MNNLPLIPNLPEYFKLMQDYGGRAIFGLEAYDRYRNDPEFANRH